MSALDQLRKSSSMSSILQQVEKATGKSNTASYNDDRFWKITRDESGNGQAVIRLLPAPMGENSPWAHLHTYKFKYPAKTGKMYWNNSLYTLGQKDPCYIEYYKLKDSSNPEDKLRAQAIQRDQDFYSNILVVNDPANPANNGKVFLFRYGKQIHKMILDKISPEFEDEQPVNVFDPWEGMNFKLRTNIGDTKLPTYLKSVWEGTSQLAKTDEEIEEIWKKCYSLEAFTAPDKFKSYEQLEQELFSVLYGTNGSSNSAGNPAQRMVQSQPQRQPIEEDDFPNFESPSIAKSVLKSNPIIEEDDEDPDFEYFANLAKGS